MSWLRVAALCESGQLSYRRPGRNYAIDRAAVERLAAERAQEREQLVSIQEAARVTGFGRCVLRRLVRSGQLDTRAGDYGARLISRAQLERVAAELSGPRPCPACGEPLPPGRAYHTGRCTGLAAAEGSRAYWRSVRARAAG